MRHHRTMCGFSTALALTIQVALGVPCVAQSADPMAIALEIGIAPEALVVAEFTPVEAQTMLSRLEAATTERQALVTAHAALDSQLAVVTTLQSQVYVDPANSELRQQLAAAHTQLTTRRQELATRQEALRAIVLQGFAAGKVQSLETFSGGGEFKAPSEFRVVVREGHAWKSIERALRAEARALRRGEELDPETAALLSSIRSDPGVQAAAVRLEQDLDEMEAGFEINIE